MKEEIIKHIGFNEICDIISKTQNLFILCLPNIDIEVAHAIVAFKNKKNLDYIKVITDNSENNFRNGFGEIDAIEKLKENGVELYELPGNMVSFIISDNIGYYLFPQSKIFAGDEDLASNAVKISQLDIIDLKNYFFPPKTESEKEKIQNEIIDKFEEVKKILTESIEGIASIEKKSFKVEKINDTNLNIVKQSLKINPPEHPDLKRKINTYISKIQFVELEFKGSHFSTLNIKIPPNALPYKDANLKKKLLTKMRLFNDIESSDNYQSYLDLQNEYKVVKDDFLKPITCRKDKSIIEIKDKSAFLEKINCISEKISEVNDSLNKLLKEEIINSRKVLKNVLQEFLKENPPEHLNQYKDSLFEESLEEEVNKIIYSIDLPNPEKILNKLVIEFRFYDLTIEDFTDDELLEELMEREIMEKGDIDSILEWKKAFEAKK